MEATKLSRRELRSNKVEVKTEKTKSLSNEEAINKKIHKIYLILALSLGLILSIGMPFFNEPDGQFHFVNSSNIAGLTTDISAYGETPKWFGYQFAHEKQNYQDGTFFEKYFETQVDLMPISQLPRSNEMPAKTNYNYWGHIIPAAGVWLGYHIYPSLGVMITVARLLNTFILSIGMFFVIRFVKRGKLLFTLVALSPVILNTFASLSYDGLSFLLAAVAVALAINTIVANKISIWRILQMIILAIIMYFSIKTNLMLLVLLFPLVVYGILGKEKLENLWQRFSVKGKTISAIIAFVLIVGALFVISRPYGGPIHLVYKLVINVIYNFNPNINVQDVNTIFVQPLATHNMMPFWLTSIWFILLVLAAFSEQKYVKSSLVSWGALGIFILNILAIYITFFTGFTSGRAEAMGAIGGVQGRYFTPMFLLFSLFAANSKFRLKVVSYRTVLISSIVMIVFSNGLLLFDTLFTILKF